MPDSQETTQTVAESSTASALLSGLNAAQREAVEHIEGPLLILAGAYLTPNPSPSDGEGE